MTDQIAISQNDPAITRWLEINFKAPRDQAEMIEGFLMIEGALSTTLIDAADQPLLEPAPGESPLWDQIVVTGLFSADASVESIRASICARVEPERSWVSVLDDQPWERSWMEHFKPIKCANIWVVPSWCEPPESGVPHVLIDPGLAFGTGNHQSTQLCLDWLSKQALKGKQVIDYGCGSGILAIAALKLGAAYAHAVDIDPLAVEATNQNAQLNGADAHMWSGLCHEFDELSIAPVDVLCANILAKPLMSLAALFSTLLKPEGLVVLAGLIEPQCDKVTQAYIEAGFEPASRVDADTGGWVSLTFSKRYRR